MPDVISPDIADMLTPDLSLEAQRAGKALAKLTEAELLGVDFQRHGLQLGELLMRNTPVRRRKTVNNRQDR